MKRKAFITIKGTQHYGADKEKIIKRYIGFFEESEDCLTLSYKEQNPSSDVKLRAYKNGKRTELINGGSCLISENGKRNICEYKTEYGNFLLGISGKASRLELKDNAGSIFFSYSIDTNGSLASENEVLAEFKLT